MAETGPNEARIRCCVRAQEMTQNISHISHWQVTDTDQAKALIKYELNYLKNSLHQYLNTPESLKKHSNEVNVLCQAIANKYFNYLCLLENTTEIHLPELVATPCYIKHFHLILSLERELARTLGLAVKKALIIELIQLYQMVNSAGSFESLHLLSVHSNQLKQLFHKPKLDLWLIGLVDFWSQHDSMLIELPALFYDWDILQQKAALDFFSETTFVDLVNTLFFYKLYPDRLFGHLIHPEKLISVRMRLGVLHYYIESIQQHLYTASVKNGLKPGVDHLLHGNELPKGIMIEVDDSFREVIQQAIKKLKVGYIPHNSQQEIRELLSDLESAYKFWFNPNRLIDAVMVLQRNLVSDTQEKNTFESEMVLAFKKLTTTECLDLYGYFANKDTKFLLYTFFAIIQNVTFDWLPPLHERDKEVLNKVFHALLSVMEALRIELKHRHVTTDTYTYELMHETIHIGHRNRDAVFRVLTLYGCNAPTHNDTMEQLFRLVEE